MPERIVLRKPPKMPPILKKVYYIGFDLRTVGQLKQALSNFSDEEVLLMDDEGDFYVLRDNPEWVKKEEEKYEKSISEYKEWYAANKENIEYTLQQNMSEEMKKYEV